MATAVLSWISSPAKVLLYSPHILSPMVMANRNFSGQIICFSHDFIDHKKTA
jgi:hypothetical protein